MNTHLPRYLTILCSALAMLGLLSPLSAENKQPRMDKAIELLEEAKTAAKPIPLLEKAREHVENAPANKGGSRMAAMKTIDEAIDGARRGNKIDGKINKAIKQLQEGKEKAK